MTREQGALEVGRVDVCHRMVVRVPTTEAGVEATDCSTMVVNDTELKIQAC